MTTMKRKGIGLGQRSHDRDRMTNESSDVVRL